jgi:hypothetical protein
MEIHKQTIYKTSNATIYPCVQQYDTELRFIITHVSTKYAFDIINLFLLQTKVQFKGSPKLVSL